MASRYGNSAKTSIAQNASQQRKKEKGIKKKSKETNKLSRSDGNENVCKRCHFDQPLRRLNYCDQAA